MDPPDAQAEPPAIVWSSSCYASGARFQLAFLPASISGSVVRGERAPVVLLRVEAKSIDDAVSWKYTLRRVDDRGRSLQISVPLFELPDSPVGPGQYWVTHVVLPLREGEDLVWPMHVHLVVDGSDSPACRWSVDAAGSPVVLPLGRGP